MSTVKQITELEDYINYKSIKDTDDIYSILQQLTQIIKEQQRQIDSLNRSANIASCLANGIIPD